MQSKGSIEIEGTKVEYCVKHFDEGAEFGIENGRISKLQCKMAGQTILNYDRGWDIEPETEIARQALAIHTAEYNSNIKSTEGVTDQNRGNLLGEPRD